jgi:hypothetical protein
MIAFWTRYRLFEHTVMQFGTNAPADFHGYISTAIREALDDFVLSDLDEFLIYSDCEEEYVGHIMWILQWLLEAGIYLKPEKCEFEKEIIRYLWLIMSTKGISLDEDNGETIQHWSRELQMNNGRLHNLFEVQQFLSFAIITDNVFLSIQR